MRFLVFEILAQFSKIFLFNLSTNKYLRTSLKKSRWCVCYSLLSLGNQLLFHSQGGRVDVQRRIAPYHLA